MKSIFILLILIGQIPSFAQLKNGDRVFSTMLSNLEFGHMKATRTSPFTDPAFQNADAFKVRTETVFGKLKNNWLISYGVSMEGVWYKTVYAGPTNETDNSHSISIGPLISAQRFYVISDRFLFSAIGKFNVGYQFGSKRVFGSLEYWPFGVAYSITPKANLIFQVGQVKMEGFIYKDVDRTAAGENKQVSTSLVLNATVGAIAIGYQRKF